MATAKERSLLGKGSDFYDEDLTYCQPCIVRGKKKSATTFCVDCRELLCGECTSHHKALSVTKDHVHVKPYEAKNAPPKVAEDKCTKKCSGHKEKRVKYYCVAHSYLGCSICFTIDHKPCKDVEHIPTVAANIQGHAGFQQFDGGIENLSDAYTASIADLQNNIKLLKADERQVHQTFQDFRKKMNDALNKLESQMSAEAKSVKDKKVKKLDALLKKLQKSKTRVDALVKDLDQLMAAGKKCDAYVMVRSELSQLTSLQEELTRTTRGQTFKRFNFQPSTDLLQVGALGKLNIRTSGPMSSWSAAPPSAPVKSRTVQPSAAVSAAEVPATKADKYWFAMPRRIKKGDRVRRGPDWFRGDEDGGPGALGTVENVVVSYLRGDRGCDVRWDNGRAGRYRMGGRDSVYELEIV